MFLFAIANFFKPVQSFLKDYMGTYVACLLSSGELPAIRIENNLKDAEPKCSFSIAKGNVKFGSTNGSSSGSGGSASDSNDPNGSGKNGKDASGSGNGSGSKNGGGDGSSTDGSGNSSGRGSYAGSRSRSSGFGRSAFRRNSDQGSGAGEGDMAGGGGKRYVNNLDRKGDDRFFRTQRRQNVNLNRYGRGVALGGTTDEEQKNERKIQAEPRVMSRGSEEFSVPPKKTVLKPPPIKETKAVEEKTEGFTLGNFFKYILIAVVLLLILILGGGQAFEMSKTMD
ncbi:MAG: hypothetical protein JNL11_12745 [Bdellovibrionaceae bacterium]|nr:hypothetical protein [Pseudobdellovibrionaceae bacterium]